MLVGGPAMPRSVTLVTLVSHPHVLWRGATPGGVDPVCPRVFDFGDFGVSFAATVAGRYTRRGGPRLSVQGEPLIVLTRGP